MEKVYVECRDLPASFSTNDRRPSKIQFVTGITVMIGDIADSHSQIRQTPQEALGFPIPDARARGIVQKVATGILGHHSIAEIDGAIC